MKYRIAEIDIEINDKDEVNYWCYNLGYHPSQGGNEFCYGNFGTNDLEASLELLKTKLIKDIDIIIDLAKKRKEEREK